MEPLTFKFLSSFGMGGLVFGSGIGINSILINDYDSVNVVYITQGIFGDCQFKFTTPNRQEKDLFARDIYHSSEKDSYFLGFSRLDKVWFDVSSSSSIMNRCKANPGKVVPLRWVEGAWVLDASYYGDDIPGFDEMQSDGILDYYLK